MNQSECISESTTMKAQDLFLDAIKNNKKMVSFSVLYLTKEKKTLRHPLLGKWGGIITKPGEEKEFSLQDKDGLQIVYDSNNHLVTVRFKDEPKFQALTENCDRQTIQPMKIFTMQGLKPHQVSFPIQNLQTLQVKII